MSEKTWKRHYTEAEVRAWFGAWLASNRPLKELSLPGAPTAQVLGKLFHQFFPEEYDSAVESRRTRAYQIGRAFEYRCREALEARGYVVFRSPQSKGAADLLALRPGSVLLVQCKTRKDRFDKDERVALEEIARKAGGIPLLAWRGRKGEGIRWETMDGSEFSLE